MGNLRPLRVIRSGQFSYSSGFSSVIDIKTANGPDGNNPFLAGVTGAVSDSSALNPGSSNYIFVSAAGQSTGSDATPSDRVSTTFHGDSVSGTKIETTILQYDSLTNQLTARWVNPDGTFPACTWIFSNAGTGAYFGCAGDYTAYYDALNSQSAITPVLFYFRPDGSVLSSVRILS